MYKKAKNILFLMVLLSAACAGTTFADEVTKSDDLRAVDRPAPIGWSLMDTSQPPSCGVAKGRNRALPVPDRETFGGAEIFALGGGGPLGSMFSRLNIRRRDSDVCTLMQAISAEVYRGQRVRLSAKLGTQDFRNGGRAGLWMRVDDANGKVASFDNMESRPITRTQDWKRYDVVLDVPADASDIAFGFLLVGKYGSVFAADFSLEPVDNSVPVTAGAPPRSAPSDLPKAPVNLDFREGRTIR